MVQSSAFIICLALTLVSVECSTNETNSNLKVTVVESLSEYLKENPDVKVLYTLEKKVQTQYASSYGLNQIAYTIGKRERGKNRLKEKDLEEEKILIRY